MVRDHRGWTDLLLGAALGLACTFAALAALNLIAGWHHLGIWDRAIANRSATALEGLMLRQIADAEAAIDDNDPYPLNHSLASSVLPELYHHYLRYSRHLLENDRVEDFNQLRLDTGFALLDLSGATMAGLDLTGVNFNGAILEGADLSGANLTAASFFMARLEGADLSEATLTGASFAQADLSNATLNSVRGSGVDFGQAVLVGTSMTAATGLEGALFESAILAQANLTGSHFPEAVFDRADLTLVSAVEADFSQARSVNDVVFTGGNLGGAAFEPAVTRRAWLEHVDGLDPATVDALRLNGGVSDPVELLTRVDRRIVDGFSAQIESDPDVARDQRRAVLLDLLQQYWLQ